MGTSPGYWEPHTASIDFCEANYRFTPFVAELLNSISSLPIAAAGPISWYFTPAPYQTRTRFILCWVVFLAVGLGSVAFHATMRRPAQALDEVPMVLGNLVFVYCLLRPKEFLVRAQLSVLLLMAGAALIVVYVVYEFYAVFLSMYGLVVVLLTAESGRLCFGDAGPNSSMLRRMWYTFVGWYLAGVVLWVADNMACAQLGVGHLHIAWHILACTGTVYFVLALVALTANDEGLRFELSRRFVFIPVLALQDGKKE